MKDVFVPIQAHIQGDTGLFGVVFVGIFNFAVSCGVVYAFGFCLAAGIKAGWWF